MLAGRVLNKLLKEKKYNHIALEEIDIVLHPARAWRDGVRMIPALKDGERSFSAVMPREKDIRHFLDGV